MSGASSRTSRIGIGAGRPFLTDESPLVTDASWLTTSRRPPDETGRPRTWEAHLAAPCPGYSEPAYALGSCIGSTTSSDLGSGKTASVSSLQRDLASYALK